MLTKLLKYEWKTTARILLPVGGGVLAFTIVTGMANAVLGSQQDLPGLIEFLQAALNFIDVLALVFVLGACVFVNVQRFYKLLGEQGYLMLSLPVPTWKHITAKLISACAWSAVCSLYLLLCNTLLAGGFSTSFSWRMPVSRITTTDVTAWLFLAMLMVALVVGVYLDFYLACAIGGQFGQQRLLASIVAYFVLGFLEQILSTVVLILLVFGSAQLDSLWIVSFIHSLNSFWGMVAVLSGIFLLLVLVDAVKWAVTQWLMTRRLNLV